MREDPRDLGARVLPGGTGVSFRVWAPRARSVELELVRPAARRTPLQAGPDGLFHLVVPDLGAGADYFFILDGERRRPDPRSRHQPEGVHGPSRVVDPAAFRWTDRGWRAPVVRIATAKNCGRCRPFSLHLALRSDWAGRGSALPPGKLDRSELEFSA